MLSFAERDKGKQVRRRLILQLLQNRENRIRRCGHQLACSRLGVADARCRLSCRERRRSSRCRGVWFGWREGLFLAPGRWPWLTGGCECCFRLCPPPGRGVRGERKSRGAAYGCTKGLRRYPHRRTGIWLTVRVQSHRGMRQCELDRNHIVERGRLCAARRGPWDSRCAR